MRYLITGGCGFLGSNIAAHALRRGDAVTLADNMLRVGTADNLAWLHSQGDVTFRHCDIRSSADVERVMEETQYDAIFHLAGQVAMTTSLESPRKDFEINVLGTINILEAMRRWQPDAAIVYASTNKVYGNLDDLRLTEMEFRYQPQGGRGVDEKWPIDFHTPYGCSKGAADQYVLDYSRTFGLNGVVFRHSTIYGGRQFSTFDQGWIGWFSEQALRATQGTNRYTINGNGKQVRDILHADDAAALYLAIQPNIAKVRGQVFNVGGGMANSLSLLELFRMLEEKLNVRLEYDILPERTSDQKFFVADISKAMNLLGWAPKVTAEQGVTGMIDWQRQRLGAGARQ